MSDHLEISEDGAVHRITVPTAGASLIDTACDFLQQSITTHRTDLVSLLQQKKRLFDDLSGRLVQP